MGSPAFLALIGLITLLGSLNDRRPRASVAPLGDFAEHLLRNLASAAVATLIIVLTARMITPKLGMLPRLALAGLVAALPVHATIVAGAALAHGAWPDWAWAPWALAREAIMVSAIAVVVGLFRIDRMRPTAVTASPLPASIGSPEIPSEEGVNPPPLLRRMPADLGTDLVRVSACDHYVEVVTRRGQALILLRLTDAIAELGGIPGMQIHRSHWVARTAMVRVVVKQRRPMLVLHDGTHLPISRSRLADVRAAVEDAAPIR